jgi:hypothetical protein
MDVYESTGDYRYLNAALKMNDFLKRLQYDCRFKEIDGALPGSHPVWGDYFPYQVNSWGVKYYADALIKEYQLKAKLLEETAR